jgi:hypothetical protein
MVTCNAAISITVMILCLCEGSTCRQGHVAMPSLRADLCVVVCVNNLQQRITWLVCTTVVSSLGTSCQYP